MADGLEKNHSTRIAIIGSGIAGMTAAHELIERGFQVTVYESRLSLGGKARTIFAPNTETVSTLGLPGEHGFRVFGGFYKHTFDIMKRIPFENNINGVYDNLYSNQRTTVTIANGKTFHIPLKTNFTQMTLQSLGNWLRDVFSFNDIGISPYEIGIFINRLMIILQSCDERRYAEYEKIIWFDFLKSPNASPLFMEIFGSGLVTLIQAIRGHEASARTIALAFYNTFSQVFENPKGGVRSLNAPTTVAWIQPWKEFLERKGVVFKTDHRLNQLVLNENNSIKSAVFSTEDKVVEITADYFLSAISIEGIKLLIQNSGLDNDNLEMTKTKALTSKWLVGAQYFLDTDVRFSEDFLMISQSPWAVTAVASNVFWKKHVDSYSDGKAKGLISVDISEWEKPGILFGKPAKNCTSEEVRAEVWAQILQGADPSTRLKLKNAKILNWTMDPTMHFAPNENSYNDGLFMNIADSWKNRPDQKTNYSNLILAGDFTQTWTDLACMEGACESGKRAANAILSIHANENASKIKIMRPDEPAAFFWARIKDKTRFSLGLPQFTLKL